MITGYQGKTIETIGTNYRPDTIKVDGIIYSMTAFQEAHGYNWKTHPSGNILCYRSEDGREFEVPQGILRNVFRAELYEAYKATGLSQRQLAEAIEVPKRTFEDWINGKRTPSKITQEAVLGKVRALKA